MQVIPAIDLHQGRCVRLFQGRYDQVTFYPHDPVELAKQYRDLGTTLLHVVDLDGAREDGQQNLEAIQSMSRLDGLMVQSGGGIRNEIDVQTRFELGIDRLVVGSLAIKAPDEVTRWLDRYGSERFVLALDIRHDQSGTPRVATHGWQEQTDTSLWQAIEFFDTRLKHVLCTDISRDGAMSGPNFRLYQECIAKNPNIRFQASGGVRHLDDIMKLADSGVSAAITGKALLEEKLSLEEIAPFLRNV